MSYGHLLNVLEAILKTPPLLPWLNSHRAGLNLGGAQRVASAFIESGGRASAESLEI